MSEDPNSRDGFNGTPALLDRLGLYATRSLRRWQIGRTTMALERLSDDMLHDIGIARADIPAIALKVTAPEPSPERASRPRSQPIPGGECTT
jgi:uncharacterized protein YjiS (DUF1127 family)